MTADGLRDTLSALAVWVSDAKADGTLSGLRLTVTLSTGEKLTVTNTARAIEDIAARDVDSSGVFWLRDETRLRQIALEHIVMMEISDTRRINTGEIPEVK